jgi:hypothetical protein
MWLIGLKTPLMTIEDRKKIVNDIIGARIDIFKFSPVPGDIIVVRVHPGSSIHFMNAMQAYMNSVTPVGARSVVVSADFDIGSINSNIVVEKR